MNYEEFLQNIKFRGIIPETNENDVNSIVAKIGREDSLELISMDQFDRIVTILPEEHDEYCKVLDPILNIPRYSSFSIAAIIHRTVREMAQDTAYVNVGIWHGFSLFAGMLGNQQKKVIGIDNFSEFGGHVSHARILGERDFWGTKAFC